MAEEKIIEDSVDRYKNKNRRNIFTQQRLVPLQKHLKRGNVLDCGCGVGVFVKILQDAGYECDGIDLSRKSIEIGEGKLQIKTLKYGDVQSLAREKKQYDAVIATTLMEHLEDPSMFLQTISKIIHKDGLLVLEFPTVDSLSFEMLKDYWYWIMSPYHLFYYSKISIDILLRRHGFRIIDEAPLNPGWMWAESIANSAGLLVKYNNWRHQDADFVKFSIEIDKIFDKIALFQKRTSSIQIYARKK